MNRCTALGRKKAFVGAEHWMGGGRAIQPAGGKDADGDGRGETAPSG